MIATAQSTIKNATSEEKLIYKQWIGKLCIPYLGLSESDVKTITLYPENGSAPKPDDCKAVIDFALYDVNGCYLRHKFRSSGGQRIYPDRRILLSATVQTPNQTVPSPDTVLVPQQNNVINNYIPVDVSEDPYTLWLGTNANLVASILMRYYTTPLDEAGFPLIKTDDAMAVVLFLQYMTALKDQENQSQISASELRWKQEADRCKARKKMLSVTNEVMKHVINSVWCRLIPNHNFEQF